MTLLWPTKKLGELTDICRGSSPRPICDTKYFEGGTVPWIKIADATKSGKYLYKTKEHVNDYGASFSRRLPPGTILVAASGTLGYTQILGVEGCAHDGWLILQNLRDLDRDFAYYALKTLEQHFFNSGSGATIQNINTDILRQAKIPHPPLSIQRRIASILSAYDDLIENNRRRIAIMEDMARRLYREWFVNFRFPGHEKTRFVASPMGKIPEGWEAKSLRDIAHEERRGVSPDEIDTNTPYVGLEHIPRRSIALTEWGTASEVKSDKLKFNKGEILFGKIRPYFHKVVVAPIEGVCSTDAIVIVPNDEELFTLTLAVVSSDDFVAQSTQSSNGTKMPRANWNVLLNYPVAIPTKQVMALFSDLIRHAVEQIEKLTFSNRNLRRTRDLLLPRLLSGKQAFEGAMA